MRKVISTDAAPAAIGTYSQAVQVGDTVYISGQIPLDPDSMQLVGAAGTAGLGQDPATLEADRPDMAAQIRRVFDNLSAICQAAGGELDDIVKLNIYLPDLGNFALVNELMAEYLSEPYPARAAIGVASLPKGAGVEMDAVMVPGSR